MEPLNFFDCNCSFGMRGVKYPGSFSTLDELIKKMDNYGIKKALVYHSMAREYDMKTGNKMLMGEIAAYPFLYPVWLPCITIRVNSRRLIEGAVKGNNIKAVRIFPSVSDHGYSISGWNCGELFDMLEKCKIPLIAGLDQVSGMSCTIYV